MNTYAAYHVMYGGVDPSGHKTWAKRAKAVMTYETFWYLWTFTANITIDYQAGEEDDKGNVPLKVTDVPSDRSHSYKDNMWIDKTPAGDIKVEFNKPQDADPIKENGKCYECKVYNGFIMGTTESHITAQIAAQIANTPLVAVDAAIEGGLGRVEQDDDGVDVQARIELPEDMVAASFSLKVCSDGTFEPSPGAKDYGIQIPDKYSFEEVPR